MAVLMLSVALTIIIIHQQQEALGQTDSNIFKRYEKPNYGIQIEYPSNWRVDEGDV
jgi:hypothetical protein